MTNTALCTNCNKIEPFYLIYVRIPIPKTNKNKWVRLDSFRICSNCGVIVLGTATYKDTTRIKDDKFELLDKIVIVPKNEADLKKDDELRGNLKKIYHM